MTPRLDRIAKQRLEKLDRIRARGTNPYPPKYQRTHTTQQAIELLTELESKDQAQKEADLRDGNDVVNVAGRITARRLMGKSAFVDIRDGSGKIQLLFQDIDQFDEEPRELFKDLDIGDIIGAEGKLLRTKTGEPTVLIGDFTLLDKSLQPLPKCRGASAR